MSLNGAYSTVATAPSPASSGTSLVVAAGTGSRFFAGKATVWPANTVPTAANLEVVTITNVATDTLTITRLTEGSSARSIVAGDQIAQGITAGMWDGLSATYAPIVEAVNTVATSGATQTIPAVTTQSVSRITLTANCTLTFPTATAGTSFTLALTQDGTGGRTVTWPASVKWPSGVAPTASAGAGKVDLYVFTCLDGASWYGSQVGADIR